MSSAKHPLGALSDVGLPPFSLAHCIHEVGFSPTSITVGTWRRPESRRDCTLVSKSEPINGDRDNPDFRVIQNQDLRPCFPSLPFSRVGTSPLLISILSYWRKRKRKLRSPPPPLRSSISTLSLHLKWKRSQEPCPQSSFAVCFSHAENSRVSCHPPLAFPPG